MSKFFKFLNQKGVIHLLPLLLIATVGLLLYITITNAFNFRDRLFSQLFPKPPSHAAGPGIQFVDSSNNVITQTMSPTVRVELFSPYAIALKGDDSKFALVKEVLAQSTTPLVLEAESMSLPSPAVQVYSDPAASAGQALVFYSNTTATSTVNTTGATNGLVVRAKADKCQGNPKMLVSVDGVNVLNTDISSTSFIDYPKTVNLTSGSHAVRVSFTNDRVRRNCDRNLRVDKLTFNQTSPTPTPTPSPSSVPTPTPGATTSPTPTSTPTPTPFPTPTPTPTPTTVSATLAEDANFTKNVVTIQPFIANPTYKNYTFSDSSLGTKTLYVKYTSSTGGVQTYNNSIQLVAQPTPTPSASGQYSHGMGLWTPSKWDTCTQAEHDSYKVVGPDGKWYPTWHPPVHTRAGGTTCTFGHEHGRDPSGSAVFPFIKQQYGGVLFGYANEILDDYNAANNITNGMLHEDHVGHKVEWENNLQLGLSNTNKINAYCDFFMKIHQGTHSKGAFTINLHELGYFTICRDPGNTGWGDFSFGSYKLVAFGVPGQIGEACNKSKTYDVGPANPPNSPTGDGVRFLPTRYCAETFFLVPNGTFTNVGLGLYEDWVSSNYLRSNADPGNPLAYFDPHFAVFLPSRYYYPGHDSDNNASNGIDNMGRSIDLCYEVEANGDQAHDGTCDLTTNYGSITGITWDDPSSRLNGVNREFYFNQTWIKNPSGPTTWYTDPFGNNAQSTPFVGSVKQSIPQIDNYNRVILESQAIGSDRNYGGNGVHAPN